MKPHRFYIPLTVWACWLLAVLFVRMGPEKIRDQLQLGLQEGCGLILETWSRMQPQYASAKSRKGAEEATAETHENLLAENRQLRQLTARLRAENEKLKSSTSLEPEAALPLMRLTPVATRVIGHLGDPLRGSTELLVSLGKQQGLVGRELVLGDNGVLIDQGNESGLSADQLAVVGRGLIGRTTRVGRWTSLVQPVTDEQFRMSVRLVRRSPLGAVEGPRGILAGTGTACRLDEVPATEAVAVGDEIYLDEIVSSGSGSIYCGRVTRADVAPAASHWRIDVAPLYPVTEVPAELQVLRAELDPQRVTRK